MFVLIRTTVKSREEQPNRMVLRGEDWVKGYRWGESGWSVWEEVQWHKTEVDRLIHFQYSTFTIIYLLKFGLFCCSRLYGKLLNVVNELFHSEFLVINSFIIFALFNCGH